jgi:hypothetical protein
MSYDHHKKAGNEGDICKHPALIAAVDLTLASGAGTPFRYADLYAGYAKNPLTVGHEWRNGIGGIAGVDFCGAISTLGCGRALVVSVVSRAPAISTQVRGGSRGRFATDN